MTSSKYSNIHSKWHLIVMTANRGPSFQLWNGNGVFELKLLSCCFTTPWQLHPPALWFHRKAIPSLHTKFSVLQQPVNSSSTQIQTQIEDIYGLWLCYVLNITEAWQKRGSQITSVTVPTVPHTYCNVFTFKICFMAVCRFLPHPSLQLISSCLSLRLCQYQARKAFREQPHCQPSL